MHIRRRSKKQRLADAAGTYLKFKAISKAVKAARKGVEGYAAWQVVKRAPAPVKALPVVAGVGAAGAAVARKRRHGEPAPA